MTINRYLLYFSYIGTRFRGVQRQLTYDMLHNDDPSSVQGLLEYALKQLQPLNIPKLHLSSRSISNGANSHLKWFVGTVHRMLPMYSNRPPRTDQGVHSFKSSAHLDLELPYTCHPNKLVFQVNNFLSSCEVPIKLISAQIVSSDFNARACAKWRKYLYRLAVIKPEFKDLYTERFVFPIPITEVKRCYFIHTSTDFDVELVKNVLPLFIGTRDFKTFMGKSGLNTDISTIRTWNNIEIVPGRSFYPTDIDKYYNYWDIHVDAKSFLYKQIRRTVGVLIKVAQKLITYDDVKYMFDNPSINSWNTKVSTAPSHGLYLYDIGYDEKDLILPIEHNKLEEPVQNESPEEMSLDLKKEIVKQRIENRRIALEARTAKSVEKIKNHEFLRSIKK
ncbi:tRNA pseudouridine synthase-like 1 isoform X1 [Rhopalosiphum maidis]|uniref:tRNA pseudouridine synthase-like 1 isoform X1 n=1 Tax=Rhopalosiphum maidis TaxID=43146 RepID=UPI000EFDC1B5|nr:tRNA pseudouridine synthase-like 1 isoform X1 [Rhopalosiphum maidis]